MESPEVWEMDKICRGCLTKQGVMRPLFGSCLDDMLRAVAQVEVKIGDGLPPCMCFQCVLQVSRAFRFKQQCEKSDTTLRSHIQEVLTKQIAQEMISEEEPQIEEVTEMEKVHYCSETEATGNCYVIFESDYAGDSKTLLITNESDIIEESIEDDTPFELQITDNNLNVVNRFVAQQSEEEPTIDLQCDEIENKIDITEIGPNDIDTESTIDVEQTIYKNEVLEGDFVPDGMLFEVKDFQDGENCNDNQTVFGNEVAEKDLTTQEIKLEQQESKTSLTTPFKCNVCDKVFALKRILKRHAKIHNPIKPHICNDCGMSFAESSNLTKHKKKHTGELRNVVGKPNLCSICGKGFKWASSLSKHMNHHTKKKILNCPYCPKYYVEARSLEIHLRLHTGEKPFSCETCGKKFTQFCNLEKHLRVHTGEKPFVCPICGKAFTQSGYVVIHMRSHTGEKPYQCNTCGKCFAGSNSLSIHKRTHTGERPFSCNTCGKSFTRQETALIHERTHSGEKPYVCKICDKRFTSSSHLSGHMRAHTGVKPFECPQCDKKFPAKGSLKTHLKTHLKFSPKEKFFQCAVCDKKFDELSGFEEHFSTHNTNK